jgi:hypothetical protein
MSETARGFPAAWAMCHSYKQTEFAILLFGNFNSVRKHLYKITILHVVLYRCETWSLMLRDEQGADENIWA